MTLTELAIKRPTIIVVIFSIIIGLGVFTYIQLNYELIPKIAPPVVTISTIYPGSSPGEVEESVTKVIENAVASLDKINKVSSTSMEGLSIVIIEFINSADADLAVQAAQRNISQIAYKLPKEARTPAVSKIAIDEAPILRMGITSNMNSKEFYQFIKDHIQPRLSKKKGVGQVVLIGGDEREIKVNLDLQKIHALRLSLLQITQTLNSSSLEFPTGNVKDVDGQYVVKLAGKISSLESLRDLVVSVSRDGSKIKLKDIAEIQDGIKEYSNISRVNGFTSVSIYIFKQTDANAVEVSKLVREEIAGIEKDYSNYNVKFNISSDASEFTIDAANAVKKDLLLAILLVAIVMLIFLHSIRNALIILVAIPASLISTFVGIYVFGFTLNLMTLLAMSLVIGILVDDSIVVLENIYRHLEIGEEKRTAALKGRNEIGFAALSITLVDVAVFLPLSLVSGIIGNILRSYALVIVTSTLLSLFVSFTITPLLASRFTRLEKVDDRSLMGRFGIWFENFFKKIIQEYVLLLKWSLNNKVKVMIIASILFLASLCLIPLGFIGTEFISQIDRGEFTVTMELPVSSTLENTNYVTRELEKIIAGIPEVEYMNTNVGASNEGYVGGQPANNISEVNVKLVPKNKRTRSSEEVGEEIKSKTKMIPGVKVHVSPIFIFGTADMAPITIQLSGTSLQDLNKAAEIVKNTLEEVPGTTDIRLSSQEGKPEMQVKIDREKMAELGLNMAEVGATIRIALYGNEDAKFKDGNTDFNIRLQLDEADRSSTENLGNLIFMTSKGQQIELKQFAEIDRSSGPSKLQRSDRNYAITVSSQVIGRPSGTIAAEFDESIAKIGLPPGVTLHHFGYVEQQTESFGNMALAGGAAFIFIFLIMVALYNSYTYPFVVIFSIPAALIGALLALALKIDTLNIFTILGMIMLMGLVAKNGILLVDRANQKKLEGLSSFDALIDAGKTRLRPIIMTTFSMIFGMLPLAISSGSGSEWKQGLGWVLIGGLTSSLFLSLILIPVVYLKFDEWRETIPSFFRKLFHAKISNTI
jgi:hydrophobic/amphiphilic exporter-1 (mainly G- bacteria), HAE1 family